MVFLLLERRVPPVIERAVDEVGSGQRATCARKGVTYTCTKIYDPLAAWGKLELKGKAVQKR